jgi:hypothetical protein
MNYNVSTLFCPVRWGHKLRLHCPPNTITTKRMDADMWRRWDKKVWWLHSTADFKGMNAKYLRVALWHPARKLCRNVTSVKLFASSQSFIFEMHTSSTPGGGLVSIPQCIAVLDHCIHIINSPAQLAQCSFAVVVNTSQKIYHFRKWRIFFAPGMGLKILFWKQWSTSSSHLIMFVASSQPLYLGPDWVTCVEQWRKINVGFSWEAMQFFYQLWMARWMGLKLPKCLPNDAF